MAELGVANPAVSRLAAEGLTAIGVRGDLAVYAVEHMTDAQRLRVAVEHAERTRLPEGLTDRERGLRWMRDRHPEVYGALVHLGFAEEQARPRLVLPPLGEGPTSPRYVAGGVIPPPVTPPGREQR